MSCRSVDYVLIQFIPNTLEFLMFCRCLAGHQTLFSYFLYPALLLSLFLESYGYLPVSGLCSNSKRGCRTKDLKRRDRNGRWSARTTRNKESNQRTKSARALKYTPDISVVLAKFSYYLKNLVTQYKNKYRVSSSGRRWQLIFTECTTEVLYTNRLTEISGL